MSEIRSRRAKVMIVDDPYTEEEPTFNADFASFLSEFNLEEWRRQIYEFNVEEWRRQIYLYYQWLWERRLLSPSWYGKITFNEFGEAEYE